MAHTCPDCGLLCHCRGDIDDCCFDGGREQMLCEHCDEFEDDDPDDPECQEDKKPETKP